MLKQEKDKWALVCGAGGFIGSHLVNRLKSDGYKVVGADLKLPEFTQTSADHFEICDLRDPQACRDLFLKKFDEVYQLAADMGGAGYVFTGDNDADILHNSALINLNVLEAAKSSGVKRIFYSSSACIYPQENQLQPEEPDTREETAYPANPDSEYGWEKLFSERLYLTYQRNYSLECRIARYHNIFGPEGTWQGGREKAPAAICRKVAVAKENGSIDIWGDGLQTRSFLYIDECIEGTLRLMRHPTFCGPVNIGSSEMVTIRQLAEKIINLSGKIISVNHIPGPQGVRGRNSHNGLVRDKLGWEPSATIDEGLKRTYAWIDKQVKKQN